MSQKGDDVTWSLETFGKAPNDGGVEGKGGGVGPESRGGRKQEPREGDWQGEEGRSISSAVGVQLCFDVNPTDWTLPAGGQPLVHAALVEEVHAGQSPGGHRDRDTF